MLHYGRYQYDKVSGRVPSTKVTMSVILRDASGKELQRKDGDEIIISGDLTPCVRSFIIENPHFWNGLKDPYQYIAEVIIKRDKQVIDNVKQKFGLRTVAISQEKGFELNGEAYPIYGVCRHQDVRDKGWAVSSEDELRDFEMIKEVGATAVRLAHYPQSANVHEIADSLGILTWDEISLVNDTRDNQTFTQNCKQFMEEMVHQLYNHPSIAWWGLFNEVNHPETPGSLSIFSELKQIAKTEGGQRITVGASNTGDRYFSQIPDAICFNNYPGWYLQQRWPARENYTGDLSRFGEFIDYRYKEFGNRRIAMSEYGAGGDPTQHIEGKLIQPADPSTVREQPEEWEAYVHEQDWKALKNNPKIWGSFIWAMFDFSMNGSRESSILNINTKGLITHDRKTKKDPFYFYKANWNPEPMVYIASRRMVERKLAVTDIKVYSNCPSVTLYLNGKKIGTKTPDLVEVCTFENITLKPGKNTIKAIVLSGKKKIQDQCEWNLSIK
jgi:beta-galactosidase